MAQSKEIIISKIKAYIQNCGGVYSDWYVGIASDPQKRLFNDHNVDRENGTWIYNMAESSGMAREIEDYFINILGTDGGPGGGDNTTKSVYAYKKTNYTVQ